MKAIVNDRMGNVEELFYDARNRGVMRREFSGRAPLANQPTTDFTNRPVSPLRVTDPEYFETRWQFNADSLATTIVRHSQNSEHFAYDSLNPDPVSQWGVVGTGNSYTAAKSQVWDFQEIGGRLYVAGIFTGVQRNGDDPSSEILSLIHISEPTRPY